MKSKAKFDGPWLILPDWKFSNRDPRVPHRHSVLAQCAIDRNKFYVCCNRCDNLFWVYATGPGLAGDNSRASNTVTTRSRTLADLWADAVRSGQVRIE